MRAEHRHVARVVDDAVLEDHEGRGFVLREFRWEIDRVVALSAGEDAAMLRDVLAFYEFAVWDVGVGFGIFCEWEVGFGMSFEDESENEEEDEWKAHSVHNETEPGGFANKIAATQLG